MPVRATSSRPSRRSGSITRGAPKAAGPALGDTFRVERGDYLEAPPRGTMWYQPGGEGQNFRLMELGRAPFRLDDLIGVHRSDEPPTVPSGKRLVRVAGSARKDAAHVYKVVAGDDRDLVWTTRGPRVGYEIGQLYSVARAPNMPDPPQGTAWEVMGPDAETRGHVWAILKRVTPR